MLQAFKDIIDTGSLLPANAKILVAVSGGVDSMVLCDLLLKSGYQFSIAHCNFNLRGDESDGDESFVKTFAGRNQLKCFVRSFDTESYANKNKLSIQMAARELRYFYFEELIASEKLDICLTAHHLNDQIETFFINLIRGAGLNGLKGIQQKNGKFVRPLLQIKKSEILDYAIKNNVAYREDSSNTEEKYLRNHLRKTILPQILELNPSFEDTMRKEFDLLNRYHSVIHTIFEKEIGRIVIHRPGETCIDIEKLMAFSDPELLLFEILHPLGFNSSQVESILSASMSIPGKTFSSDRNILVKDRTNFIVKPLGQKKSSEVHIVESTTEIVSPVNLKFRVSNDLSIMNSVSSVKVDFDKLIFPLKLRGWQKGDAFRPLGMKGMKKLSDFFISHKLNQFEKEEVKLIENGDGAIVWIINHRLDDRFKLTSSTKKAYQIESF